MSYETVDSHVYMNLASPTSSDTFVVFLTFPVLRIYRLCVDLSKHQKDTKRDDGKQLWSSDLSSDMDLFGDRDNVRR